ncbi:Tetratricopeptide repeat protein 9C [Bulinus truncatus]|nr:Tetratricopeptide repeat protein 9C [Bulinus truncatus]
MALNTDVKLTDSDKLLKAKEYKDKGNAAYKNGNFRQAAGSYHRAILYLKGLSSNCPDLLSSLRGIPSHETQPAMTVNMLEDAKTLTCDCHNNLAACMLKDSQPKYQRIIEHCNTALEAWPNNTKALFRKGISQYSLGDYEEALDTLERATPDPSVRKYIELCKAGIKNQDKAMAEKFKGMFKS